MKRGALASAGTARADGRTVAKHADLGSVGGVGAGTIGAIGGGLIGHMIENRESGPTWLGAKGGGALGIAPAGVEREGDDGTLTGASLGALGAASIALVELVAKADKRSASIALVELVAKADKRVTHLVRSRAPC